VLSSINVKSRRTKNTWLAFICEWRRLKTRRRLKMLAPPPAEFSTARRLEPARQPDFTAASRKRFGGAAEESSYRVNEQGKYRTQVLQIFFTIKTPCSGRHATVYTVSVAVLSFKVIQN